MTHLSPVFAAGVQGLDASDLELLNPEGSERAPGGGQHARRAHRASHARRKAGAADNCANGAQNRAGKGLHLGFNSLW